MRFFLENCSKVVAGASFTLDSCVLEIRNPVYGICVYTCKAIPPVAAGEGACLAGPSSEVVFSLPTSVTVIISYVY